MEDVKMYYDEYAMTEENRLDTPYAQVEYRTTLHILEKYLPKKGKVLDLGAATGKYSLELLKRGYEVSLLDLSEEELRVAKQRITDAGYSAENYYCQSAVDLDSFESESLDAVLVLGPMYHLGNEEDRNKVLINVKRILKTEGIAIIAYINTWGALKASVFEFPESFADEQHFERYIEGNLKLSKEESFTATFFTTPPHALNEVEDSGLRIISRAGAESFLASTMPQIEKVAKGMPEIYENYIKKAVQYSELPQYRDATEHLLIIAKK